MNKTNDMLLETLANPSAKTYDFLNNGITSENTQLLDKSEYKRKDFIKEQFTQSDGKFDELGFDNAYAFALHNFNNIANDELIEKMDQVQYDPFDLSRPIGSETWNVDVKFSQDVNPFQQLYSRDSINSITESTLSLREIAQKGKVYDPETDTWSESINKSGLFTKVFGDTLVYAQWDEDGIHTDPINGHVVNHKKGDWKIDDSGSLYLEKLGNREIYGKQVVNPSDILTTDGSVFNKFDFFDSDGREKSIPKTAIKTIVEIAPLLIPGVNTWYGGTRAAIGLASVMPTFYKSIEGWLLGDNKSTLSDPVTKAEGWMAKFNQTSSSDAGAEGLWNFEQMSTMITDIFSQIYEQRAMASLSKYLMRPDKLLDSRVADLQFKTLQKSLPLAKKHNIDIKQALKDVIQEAPDIQAAFKKQSQLSKALSLGYMALVSTGDVYGEAIESGYDRRTAGFAALLTASGQYGIMMNNKMGDWFLDKTTGYNVNVNRALMSKSVKPWLQEINDILKSPESVAIKRNKLAQVTRSVKKNMNNLFSESSIIGEAMLKNSLVEGIEEVTEQVVQDMSKGVIDLMNYLGLTKGKGDFRTIERYATGEAFQEYLANFVGGILGGGLFELERSKISPWILNKGKVSPEIRKSIYELVANGQKDDLIREIKKQGKYLTNDTLSYIDENGDYKPIVDGESQADLVITKAIEMITALDNTFNSEGLNLTDSEIINKALRNKVILSELENFKTEGKHVGIEGLVLEDFRNNALEISKIKDEITSLEKVEGSEEQIKAKKEQLRPLIKKRDDILSGDLGMEYFDQIAVLLNPAIKELFGSLDKDTFVKAKYDKNFLDLPLSGEGITRESVDQEWQDFVDSTDMKSKLKVMTEAYKALEATLNPTIAQYTSSGYDVLRKQVYDTVIDLNRTIQQFNTATDQKLKADLLENFIRINNDLEQIGALKVTPWDVLNYDAFEGIFKEGLVKKSDLSSYSDAELQTVQANGLTLLENIKSDFNDFSKLSPINPLDIEAVIERFNYNTDSHNADIDSKIEKLRQTGSTDPDVLKQISDLELSRKNYRIDSLDNTEIFKNETKKIQDEINVEIGNATSDPNEFNRYAEVYNNSVYEKDFQSIIKEINPDADTINDLSETELSSLIDVLQTNGAWILAKDYFNGKEAEEIIRNAELGNIDKNKLEEVFKYVSDEINSGYNLLQNEPLSKAYQFSLTKQAELEEFKEKNKPEFFKLKNVSFDFLLNNIEQGLNDEELYNQLKLMFEEAADAFIKVNFSGMESVSYEDLTWIINNRDQLIQDISDSLEPIREGHVSDGPLSKFENHYLFENKDFLKQLIFKNFPPTKSMEEILNILIDFDTNFDSLLKTHDIIPKFLEFEKKKLTLKSNPLYDFIRNFSLTLNSNPENKVNKIFDILEKEESFFRATSGASNFSADNIRESDLTQAINTLQMIAAVVSSMSTTSYYDDNLSGFIAMRQQYAKQAGIDDNVLNLSLLNSDQAGVMINDLNKLIVKLQFIKDLSISNSLKKSAEHEIIRNNMNLINYSIYESLAKNEKLSEFIPKDFETILQSKEENEKKLISLEESFYKHNKNQKHKALEALLKYEYSDEQKQRVDVDQRNNITKDTKRGEITPYTKVIYLTTVLSSSAIDFQLQYVDTLSNRLDKAPFYMQEQAARIIKASTENPELFAKIYELKRNDDNDWGAFLTIVLGGAGTGKTTAVSATVLDILRQTNDSSKIVLAAPNQDQANKFQSDMVSAIGKEKISFSALDKKSLFALFGKDVEALWQDIDSSQKDIANNNGKDKLFEYKQLQQGSALVFNLPKDWDSGINFDALPNLLVIDEITHFSTAELVLLNAISEKSNSLGKFMKVVGLGDQNQMGFQIEDGKGKKKIFTSFNINSLNSTFTPTLMTSIRESNDQKKLNTTLILGLVNESIKIFDKHNSNESLDAASIINKANTEFESNFLMNNKQNIGLKYYLKDNEFKGDYIQNNLGDLSVINAIKKQLEENKNLNLGILTLNGKIDSAIEKLLQDVGIEDFKIYTTSNIQGSESDFFIFNTDVIKDYDKTRDFIKSFYTYMSRSKIGTLIVDSNNVLQSKYNITNSQKSQYAVSYEPLTKPVVDAIKNNRIDKIKELVAGAKLSEDLFKWKSGEVKRGGKDEGDGTADDDIINILNKLYNSQDNKYNITASEFKPMMHSFYNNFNTTYSNGIIHVNPEGPSTDLNGHQATKTKKESEKIIKQWGNLKARLLFSKVSKINDLEYENYFKHIFKNYFAGKPVDVELKLTLSKYDSNTNSPQHKFGSKQENMLKDSDPFINLSAKLTYEGNVQYVTLATFSKESTMITAIANISEKGLSEEEVAKLKAEKVELVKNVTASFSSIRNKLKTLNNTDIVELSDLDNSDLEIITSTRIIKTENEIGEEDTFTLVDLQEKFLGLNISEIRQFPGNKNSFKNLYKKYTFGNPLSDEQLDNLYSKLQSKPYVVVSFNNDLDGHDSKKVFARIIPLKAKSRSLEKLSQEVKILYSEYTKSINQHYKYSSDPMVFDEELDSKTQMLIGRTNILDLLITWATIKDNNGKSVIDLLTDSISGDTETSVLDVTNRFRDSNETTNQLQQVIQHVKDVVNLNLASFEKTKSEIVKRISGNSAWNRSFYNLFVYKDIIKDAKAMRQSNQNKADTTSERKGNLLTDEQYDTISKNIDELFSYVRDFKFYYNIPIKNTENGYVVDPKVDGSKGFSSSLFHNQFYVNLTPESPRVLISKNKFFDIPKTINKTNRKPNTSTSSSLKEFYVNMFYPARGFAENITNSQSGLFRVHSIKDNVGIFSVNVNSLDGIKNLVSEAQRSGIVDFGSESIDVTQIVDYKIESDGEMIYEENTWQLTVKPVVKIILKSGQNNSDILSLSVEKSDGSIIPSPLQALGELDPDLVGQDVVNRVNLSVSNYVIDNELNNLQNIQTFLAENLGIGYDNQTMSYSAMPIVRGLVGDIFGTGEYAPGQKKLINVLKIAKDLANNLNQCK